MTKIYVHVGTPWCQRCFMVEGKYGLNTSSIVLTKISEVGLLSPALSDWVFDFFRNKNFSASEKFGNTSIYISRTIPLSIILNSR